MAKTVITMALSITQTIKKNMAVSSFLAFGAGLLTGAVYPLPILRLLIPLALLLMLFPAFWEMDRKRLIQVGARPLPLLLALLLNLLAAPVVMFGLLSWTSKAIPAGLMVGLLLFGMIPGGGMGPAYTAMLGGNVNLSVVISASSLLLSLGSVPLWSWLLIGKVVTVPVTLIIRYLLLIILLPMILAAILRGWIIRRRGQEAFSQGKGLWQHVSVLGLLMVLFFIPAGEGGLWVSYTTYLWGLILPAATFTTLIMVTAEVTGRAFRLPAGDCIALTVGATTKNTAIALALATAAFGGRGSLAIAVAGPLVQLPIMLCYLKIRRFYHGVTGMDTRAG